MMAHKGLAGCRLLRQFHGLSQADLGEADWTVLL